MASIWGVLLWVRPVVYSRVTQHKIPSKKTVQKEKGRCVRSGQGWKRAMAFCLLTDHYTTVCQVAQATSASPLRDNRPSGAVSLRGL